MQTNSTFIPDEVLPNLETPVNASIHDFPNFVFKDWIFKTHEL